jgi:hypothetical protein
LKYVGGDIKTAKGFFMKRTLAFFIVGIVLFGSCSAQRTNAQNTNIAQRLIGTWVDSDGITWVFNADGTGTVTNVRGDSEAVKFAIADTKLAIFAEDRDSLAIFSCAISSDGKQLILEKTYGSSFFGGAYWLSKK